MNSERKHLISQIREAIEKERIFSITFYWDKSGAEFYFSDPKGNHGLPCTMSVSLNFEEACEVLRGHRLKFQVIES